MFRVARTAKTLVNIGLFLLFLLILYLLNSDEGQFNPELRENILSDYDYYMDEYKGEIEGEADGVDDLVLADLGGEAEPKDVNKKDTIDKEKNLPGGSEGGKKMVDELVIVVVSKDESDDSIKDSETKEDRQNNKIQTLDSPSEVPEIEGGDVLRENDVMIDNVIIDRSEDLLDETNDTLSSMDVSEFLSSKGEKNSSAAYYKPVDLLPIFKKPPADRNAPGEFGHPFAVPSRLGPSVERQIEEGYKRHAFNVLVSDIISIHRNLGDKREEECKVKKFKKPLPMVSIIICFRNEALSTLLRTLYSVMETVPGLLLKEIILVDDDSHLDLHEVVQTEIEDLPLVKMIRTPVQVGITQARMLGVKLATGDVVTFLDSHCECYEGWIEPLLNRIKEYKRVIALPIMDIINPDNFKFSVTPMQRVQRGGFDWTLTYRWIPPPRERFKNPMMDMTQPVPTPTMSGGVFAIDRNYFKELGNYDEKIRIWGGENLEMSFRAWMCGGRIEILPCSHVGHVFKSRNPHNVPKDVILANKRRVAEVWLDGYKSLFFKRTPVSMKVDAGNVTSRLELRKKLSCQSFKWYIDNVYPELYVPELKPKFSGALCCRFGDSVDVCLDTHTPDVTPGRPLGVDRYQEGLESQYFEFTKQNEIRQGGIRDVCVASKDAKVEIQKCKYPFDNSKSAPPSQQWTINQQPDKTAMLVHRESNLCLTASTGKLWMEKCDSGSIRQKWRWT